MFSCISNYY